MGRPALAATVEHDAEPNRAVLALARAAGTGDARFPIALLFIELAGRIAAFGHIRPVLVRARELRDAAAVRNGNLAASRGLILGHAEITHGLRRRGPTQRLGHCLT